MCFVDCEGVEDDGFGVWSGKGVIGNVLGLNEIWFCEMSAFNGSRFNETECASFFESLNVFFFNSIEKIIVIDFWIMNTFFCVHLIFFAYTLTF